VLIVMTVLLEIFAWPVTWALSGRFNGVSPDQFAFAVAPDDPLSDADLAGVLAGRILNSLNQFWVNAAAPILLNLTLIFALLFFHASDPFETAQSGAGGHGIGRAATGVAGPCGVAQWRVAAPPPATLHARGQRLLALWPAAAGAGAVQINLVISTALAASLLDHGSVTYIIWPTG
jgi:putative peptidoglycan lipid II flippase